MRGVFIRGNGVMHAWLPRLEERNTMGIGVSVFLIAVGAILAFATDVSVSGLDLDVVGIILVIVGVIGLLITLLVWAPRRRVQRVQAPVEDATVTRRRRVVEERPVVEDRPVVEERRTYDDPTL
jgi:hypothetical protein